jgi:hypothetical protein
VSMLKLHDPEGPLVLGRRNRGGKLPGQTVEWSAGSRLPSG